MCIIIDTNTLSCVFDSTNKDHDNFKPVLDWIYNGKGIIIFGGTKYLDEIKVNYLNLFLQFKKARKAIFVDNIQVDRETDSCSAAIVHKDFDDQHLVGLLKVSGCKLICSGDARAFRYFTHNTFFSPSSKKPKIYSSRVNLDLLVDTNIADVCKPCQHTTNAQRTLMTSLKIKKR